jgi:biopolymer transport protein ExbD
MEEREFDVINVIPFIDIMLVLLTIVLTTSTFIIQGAMPVELPRASRNQAEMLKTQTIVIDRSGQLSFNGRRVTMAALCDCMVEIGRGTPVLIRADRHLILQTFVDVMDRVKNMGFRKVSLQTEPLR